MIKKTKKINNSTNQNLEAKNVDPRRFIDEYRNMNTMKKVPIDSIIIEEMAQAIVSIVDKDENILNMTQIYAKFGLLEREFVRLKSKYPPLAEAFDYAIERLADRREFKAADNKWNWAVIAATQPYYSKVAKEMTEWRSALRNKEENKSQNISVYLEPIPNSDLVPAKKEKK